MADEAPGGWELHRSIENLTRLLTGGIGDLRKDLANLATKESVDREARRLDDRINETNSDIADERAAREKAVSAEKQARDAQMADIKASIEKLGRTALYVAGIFLVPIGGFFINYITQGK